MRNLKKFLALVLAMMMALSMVVTANAASWNSAGGPFDDNKDVTPVFDEGVSVVTGMKIFEGDNNGDFRPAANITRAEAAAVVYRLATGDVKDKDGKDDSYLWTNVAPFYDVTPDKWYAGYVGYLWNAEIIKGANAERTAFNPTDEVTGYEVLAMVLRAMGYDVNDEFTGAGWQIRVGQTANDRNLLVNVNTTNYGSGHLNAPARRDTIAEIVFQAAKADTVVYTPAFGYQTGSVVGGLKNPTTSLGYTNFGLTEFHGIVTGNQYTGETVTKMTTTADDYTGSYSSASYIYGGLYHDEGTPNDQVEAVEVISTNYNFDHTTPLTQFGHANKVWYNAKSGSTKHTYAWLDEATKAEVVYTKDEVDFAALKNPNSALVESAKTAGFTVSTDSAGNVLAFGSDKYDRMNPLAMDNSYHFEDDYDYTDTDYSYRVDPDEPLAAKDSVTSPIKMYRLISNSASGKLDVIISLDAEVARIYDTNTTASSTRIVLREATLGGENLRNNTQRGEILTSHLTPTSVQTLGTNVEAWVVDGTLKGDYENDKPTRDINSFYDTIAVKNGPTGTVRTIDLNNGDVELTDGQIVHRSYLYDVVMGRDGNERCITQTELQAGVTYTFVVDQWGRYLGTTTATEMAFIYGTYADHDYGTVGSGDLNYFVYGVGLDGTKTLNHPLTQLQNSTDYPAMTAMDGNTYNDIEVARRDYGNTVVGNQVAPGVYRGGYITPDGKWIVNDESRALATRRLSKGNTVNDWNPDAGDWQITSTDAARGFKDVSDAKDGSLLVTNNTVFYVVSGTGTSTLNVQTYTGMTNFLDGATEVLIEGEYQDPGVALKNSGDTYDVVYFTNSDPYHSVSDERPDQNGMVTKVFVYKDAVKRNSTTTMYYIHDNSATGLKLYDNSGIATEYDQYELWQGATKSNLFLSGDIITAGTKAAGTPDADTFYTLQKAKTVNGIDVYDLVAVNDGVYTAGRSCWEYQDIAYFATNETSTGRIGDTGSGSETVYGTASATVVDLTKKSTMHTNCKGVVADTAHDSHNEITNVAELYYAISVGYDVKVSITNTGSNVNLIYVVHVDDAHIHS